MRVLLITFFTHSAYGATVVLEDFNWTDGFSPAAHGWTLVGSPNRSGMLTNFFGSTFLPLFGSTVFPRLRVDPDQIGERLSMSKTFLVLAGDVITMYDAYRRLESSGSPVIDSFSITGSHFDENGVQVGDDLVFRQGLSTNTNDGHWLSQSVVIPSNGTLLVRFTMGHDSSVPHTVGKEPSMIIGALHADRMAPVPLPPSLPLLVCAFCALSQVHRRKEA